jgi:S-formylglutathione hydrolase FrmB
MSNCGYTFLLFFLSGFFFGCDVSSAQETIPQEERASEWVTEAVLASNVQQVIFESAILGQKVSFHLYLPPAYHQQATRDFPVLYWLHGLGGGLGGIPPLVNFYHQAISSGLIAPMLIVFPYSLDDGMWSNSKDGKYPVEDVFIQELIPYIDAQFRTQASKQGRIMEGFSMGGHGAARLGFKYPELFAAISFFGAGPLHLDFLERGSVPLVQRQQVFAKVYGNDQAYFEAQHPKTWASIHKERIKAELPFRIAVGKSDGMYPFNLEFKAYLLGLGHTFDFAEVPEVGHVTLPLLRGLGTKHWEFYKTHFN